MNVAHALPRFRGERGAEIRVYSFEYSARRAAKAGITLVSRLRQAGSSGLPQRDPAAPNGIVVFGFWAELVQICRIVVLGEQPEQRTACERQRR
jgi:hypothetical protein